jgi:hypothetical protein
MWLAQADEDDIEYALELVYKAKAEFIIEDMEHNDNVINLTEAKKLIDRIKNV